MPCAVDGRVELLPLVPVLLGVLRARGLGFLPLAPVLHCKSYPGKGGRGGRGEGQGVKGGGKGVVSARNVVSPAFINGRVSIDGAAKRRRRARGAGHSAERHQTSRTLLCLSC